MRARPSSSKTTKREQARLTRARHFRIGGAELFLRVREVVALQQVDVWVRCTSSDETYRRTRKTVRFETPPGKQAQADWAYCGRVPDANGTIVPVYAFVIVLAWSRMMYVQFTTSMKLPWLIRCYLVSTIDSF